MENSKYQLAQEYKSLETEFNTLKRIFTANSSINFSFYKAWCIIKYGYNLEHYTNVFYEDEEFAKEFIELLKKYEEKYKEKFNLLN